MTEFGLAELLPRAERAAQALRAAKTSVAVAESASGGLVCAALLALPGASAYFLGGGVIYTASARHALLGIEMPEGMRSASEAYALAMARRIRETTGADWAIAETGAAGPSGNRYGDPPGHAWLAVAGAREASRRVATGSADRLGNMHDFAAGALDLLVATLAS